LINNNLFYHTGDLEELTKELSKNMQTCIQFRRTLSWIRETYVITPELGTCLSSGLSCLSWGPLYNFITIRTIIHNASLTCHYPIERSLKQNI